MTDTTQQLTPWTRTECVAHVKAQIEVGRQNRTHNAQSHSPKLHPVDAREIKDLLAEGNMTQRAIGQRYRVSQTTISQIHNGHLWKTAA